MRNGYFRNAQKPCAVTLQNAQRNNIMKTEWEIIRERYCTL